MTRLSTLSNLFPSTPNTNSFLTSPNVNIANGIYSPALSLLSAPNILSTPLTSTPSAYFLPPPPVNFPAMDQFVSPSKSNGNGSDVKKSGSTSNGNWIQYEVNPDSKLKSNTSSSSGSAATAPFLNPNALVWGGVELNGSRSRTASNASNSSNSSNGSVTSVGVDITTDIK